MLRIFLFVWLFLNDCGYFILSSSSRVSEENEQQKLGYILYCPCMGRFGNQADQFIGALSFTKGLRRTLVLPPWITYPKDRPFQSLQVPFDRWFKVDPLSQYVNVVTMEHFMKHIAGEIWPVDKRIGFCYIFRDKNKCSMKEGNPFGPFWDHFNVSFTSYHEHYPLLWNTEHNMMQKNVWLERFPSNKYPVLAFQGAPGDFPSMKSNQHIQKYIEFSEYLNEQADNYIKNVLKQKKFIGIHLRNGIDFTRVCDDLEYGKYDKIFSSLQCTGYNNEIQLTKTMCHPSKEEVLRKIKEVMKNVNAEALYVASDNDPLKEFLEKNLQLEVYYRGFVNEIDDPLIDIAILSKSDYFIGNCVSSFSAFVRRQRESRHLLFDFFGMPTKNMKVEL